MANGDIRQKIVLEGEQEYSKALKEAQRNLKVLRSELKAETAELGKNATEQQKAETKAKNLKKQIAEQEKVVSTYRAALEEVRKNYGDNAEAVAKWETKLNDARAALGNMRSQLDNVGGGFKQVETGAGRSVLEMNALAESFNRISDVAGSMSSAIESAFSGAVSFIKDSVGAIWGELMDIAAKSDNYMDLASFLGTSATDVQKWDHAMKAAHGDLSAITGLITRMKYGGKNKSVTEWFGISGENYTNDLAYAEAVLSKMAEDKAEMVAAGTWDDAMGDIFGAKKVQEIDSILSDWDEIQRNLEEFEGVGLTEDELQTMNDLYSQVGLLQEKWNAFKESVTTKIFGTLALNLTSNFQGALDALIAFMDAETAEEREKALEDFTKNIEEAFTKLGEAIQAAGKALDEAGKNLQGSENSYVKLLGDLMVGLSKAMEWITTEGNLQKVLDFFTAIFDLWIVGKGAAFVTKIVSAADAFKTIFSSSGKIPGVDTSGGGDTSGPVLPTRVQRTKTAKVSASGGGFVQAVKDVAGSASIFGPILLALSTIPREIQKVNQWAEERSEWVEEETGRVAVKTGGYAALMGGSEEAQNFLALWDLINNRYNGGDAEAMRGGDFPIWQLAEQWIDYQKRLEESGYDYDNVEMSPALQALSGALWDNPGGMSWDDLVEIFADYSRGVNDLGDYLSADAFYEQMRQIIELYGDELLRELLVPSDSWGAPNGETIKTELSENASANIGRSVAGAVSGIRVYMDGAAVGNLVAPYVSQQIAREAQ